MQISWNRWWQKWSNFTDKQKEAERLADNYGFLLYGGESGGGKSYFLRKYPIKFLIEYCWHKLGLKGVRTGLFCEDYPALWDRHISLLKYEFPTWLGEFKGQTHEFVLDDKYGGGVIAFRNLDDPSKYLSAQFAMVAVDELTKNPKETFDFLRLRKRWPGIPKTKFIAGSNPGGIGHNFVKKIWIDRDFEPQEQERDEFVFLKAGVDDNPYLPKEYIASLDSLPEKMRKAYREGNWDIFSGQFFCFDEKTEVLTQQGFKLLKDLTGQEIIATRKNRKLEYEKLTKIWKFPYRGKMIEYSTENGLDFCVTPNHRMIVSWDKKTEKIIEAKDLKNEIYLPRTANWVGKSPNGIVIPTLKEAKKRAIKLKVGDFMDLLGWYLSEGCLIKYSKKAGTFRKYSGIAISQTNKKGRGKIEILLNKLSKLGWNYHGHSYEIASTSLAEFFKPLGNTYTKFIPREYLNFEKEHLQRLFNSLMAGDGCEYRKESWLYSTASKQLANDVQELATKLGKVATISKRLYENPNYSINYVVHISGTKRKYGIIHKEFLKEIDYSGNVWCVSIPNGIIFTRRNGKCVWIGNSEWNRDYHTCPPFPIPSSWKRFRAYDYGIENPACCLWFALDYDGRVFVYREWYKTGLDAESQAQEINNLSEGEEYQWSVADSAIFAPTGIIDKHGGSTIAETFLRNGIQFFPASKRRIDGWNLLHQYLRYSPFQQPKIIFFNTCENAVKTIPSLIHDEKRPEDVDSRGDDHCGDVTRYMLMALHEMRTPEPLTPLEQKLKKQQEANEWNLSGFYSGEQFRKSF